MFSFYLFSVLVFTGIGHSSAQGVSLCVCVCFICISFLFGLVCNKRMEWYDVILLLFCWGPNLNFLCSLFLFFLFLSLPGSAIFFCAGSKFVRVCVCVLFPFHFCSVLFVMKEGKGKMLYFVVVFVEVRILIFHVLFISLFFSCLYRDRPFFCAACKFVFVHDFHFFGVGSCL